MDLCHPSFYELIMANQIFRIILVIGENHQEIIKKYSANTKIDSYLYLRRADAGKNKEKRLKIIKEILNNDSLLTDIQKEAYQNVYMDLKEMDDLEYFASITEGCTYDDENGDAYSTENPNAYYKNERCPQISLDKYGEESTFANPFMLKNGTISYTAKVDDIDWSKMHMINTLPYEIAWETVVEGRKPKTDKEKTIYSCMKNRINYFTDNFKSKEEYLKHSCSFWCYGVATNEWYKEIDYTISDIEWTSTFYDKYIKTLKGDEVLTLYEVKAL